MLRACALACVRACVRACVLRMCHASLDARPVSTFFAAHPSKDDSEVVGNVHCVQKAVTQDPRAAVCARENCDDGPVN